MPVLDLFKRFVGAASGSGERRGDDRIRASLGARVLVVDDSATIRAVLGKMLSQDGYEVLKAPDGENAVEMAQSQFPDLIFLDIVLPGMSGFAVLRALRRDTRTRTTPIIMMSGNQQATEQFYVQRFGADGFIKKPFGRAEVFHSIRSLVQAGRMAERVEVPAPDAIPEGMTPEEWESIPDVAMPDEAHAAGHAGHVHPPHPAEARPATPAAAATPDATAPAASTTATAAAAPAPAPVAPAPLPADAVAAEAPPAAPVLDAPVPGATAAGTSATATVEQPLPAAPAAVAAPFTLTTPANPHASTRTGFAGFWSLRALSQRMRPSVTAGPASQDAVKFDVGAAPAKTDEAARK